MWIAVHKGAEWSLRRDQPENACVVVRLFWKLAIRRVTI